jgi:hypothetical protein
VFPGYDRISLDPDANPRVRRFRRPGESERQWAVFSPDRRLLETVEVPGNLEIPDIGTDFVLATARDDMGIERVRLYHLVKPSAQ